MRDAPPGLLYFQRALQELLQTRALRIAEHPLRIAPPLTSFPDAEKITRRDMAGEAHFMRDHHHRFAFPPKVVA